MKGLIATSSTKLSPGVRMLGGGGEDYGWNGLATRRLGDGRRLGRLGGGGGGGSYQPGKWRRRRPGRP